MSLDLEAKFYDTKEVAELLNVSTKTVIRWIKRGEIRALNVGGSSAKGKRWRITEKDLKNFIDERTTEPDNS